MSLRKPKFKVGDKVKVLRASTDEERCLWCDIWFALDMDDMIGREYTIREICPESGYEYPSYNLGNYRLPEFVLQNKIQVGEQLLLFEL